MCKKTIYLSLVLFILLASQLDVSAQCAMCKQAAESSMRSNPNSMARGLNSGILYLMAVPYLLIAFIFRKQIYKFGKAALAKRKRAEQ